MRAVVLASLLGGLLGSATTGAAPTTQLTTTAQPAVERVETPALDTMLVFADALGLDALKAQLLAPVLYAQVRLRDAAQGLADRLVAITDVFAVAEARLIPDVSVLRVHPVANHSTSGFGWREDPIRRHKKFHSGADIKGKHGTPVVAAGDGVVTFCGSQGGYGNVIYVDHGGGVITRYAHLRRLETKKGAAVLAGQRIGQVGSTGRTTGPHLHFEVRLDGRPVDPVAALDVGELLRTEPTKGQLAAYSLAPELQSSKYSEIDPPKDGKKSKGTRPERPGRTKRAKPLS